MLEINSFFEKLHEPLPVNFSLAFYFLGVLFFWWTLFFWFKNKSTMSASLSWISYINKEQYPNEYWLNMAINVIYFFGVCAIIPIFLTENDYVYLFLIYFGVILITIYLTLNIYFGIKKGVLIAIQWPLYVGMGWVVCYEKNDPNTFSTSLIIYIVTVSIFLFYIIKSLFFLI